jgi:hypothetical protein
MIHRTLVVRTEFPVECGTCENERGKLCGDTEAYLYCNTCDKYIVTCMLQAMWHVLTTIARRTPRDMFSMWSDPSLLRNDGKATCCTGSVPRQQREGRVLFVVCSRAI